MHGLLHFYIVEIPAKILEANVAGASMMQPRESSARRTEANSKKFEVLFFARARFGEFSPSRRSRVWLRGARARKGEGGFAKVCQGLGPVQARARLQPIHRGTRA